MEGMMKPWSPGGLCLRNRIWMAPVKTALAAGEAPLKVAVVGPDTEAIVKEVGKEGVETFALFAVCILRRDLQVEPSVQPRLLPADAVA